MSVKTSDEYLEGVASEQRAALETLRGQINAAAPGAEAVSYTHLRAHETVLDLVCRLLLEKKTTHTSHPRRAAYSVVTIRTNIDR